MIPSNTKSMFSMLCIAMEKLDNDEIDVSKAIGLSKLIAQANGLLNYELKRALLMSNPVFADQHRNLESKKFDSLNP